MPYTGTAFYYTVQLPQTIVSAVLILYRKALFLYRINVIVCKLLSRFKEREKERVRESRKITKDNSFCRYLLLFPETSRTLSTQWAEAV